MKKMIAIGTFLSFLLVGCNQVDQANLVSSHSIAKENHPLSTSISHTHLSDSSNSKNTTPTTAKKSKKIIMVKNFDITKLRLMSVKLVGKTDIWAWGYDSSQKGRLTLLSSNNNGKTWDKIIRLSVGAPGMFPGPGGLPFEEVANGDFIDMKSGWLAWVKDGEMTTDWIHDNRLTTIQTAVPTSATVVKNLDFINSKEGFALLTGKSIANEEHNFLLETRDSGQHWSQVDSNRSSQFLKHNKVGNLIMTGDGNGWIVDKSHVRGLPTLFHTTNAGKNWSKITLPVGSATQAPPQITGISTPVTDRKGNVTIVAAFASDATKYQVTYHSSDKGASWNPVANLKFKQPATDFSMPLLNYVSSTIGYGVKAYDLYQTTDGGKSWKVVSQSSLKKLAENYAGPISEIHFESEQRGYTTSEGNDYNRMILLTSDGGQIWMRLN